MTTVPTLVAAYIKRARRSHRPKLRLPWQRGTARRCRCGEPIGAMGCSTLAGALNAVGRAAG
jgi:hypothetical protein